MSAIASSTIADAAAARAAPARAARAARAASGSGSAAASASASDSGSASASAAAAATINVWVKTMSGDLFPLQVYPHNTLEEVAYELTTAFPQFSLSCTRVMRMEDEKEDAPVVLEADEVLCVFVHDLFSERMWEEQHMIVVQHPQLEITFAVTHFLDEGLGIAGIPNDQKVARYELFVFEDDVPVNVPHTCGWLYLSDLLDEKLPSILWLGPEEKQRVHEGIESRMKAYYRQQDIDVVHAHAANACYYCGCGSDILYRNLATHQKTKKHQAYLKLGNK